METVRNPVATVFDTMPDLSQPETRKRLSQSAMDGLIAIADQWHIPEQKIGELLGGIPQPTLIRMKVAAGTLKQDELTRIAYLVRIHKALHILLPADHANRWMTHPNDDRLFGGRTPLEHALRNGIAGLRQICSLLDAARYDR